MGGNVYWITILNYTVSSTFQMSVGKWNAKPVEMENMKYQSSPQQPLPRLSRYFVKWLVLYPIFHHLKLSQFWSCLLSYVYVSKCSQCVDCCSTENFERNGETKNSRSQFVCENNSRWPGKMSRTGGVVDSREKGIERGKRGLRISLMFVISKHHPRRGWWIWFDWSYYIYPAKRYILILKWC